MNECLNREENRTSCNCTYELCVRKGMCCECLRYHLNKAELPACCFSSEIEKTFDRSFKKFIEGRKGS